MATDQERNQVDAVLKEIFQDDVDLLFGLMCILSLSTTSKMHYVELHKLCATPDAVKAYAKGLLRQGSRLTIHSETAGAGPAFVEEDDGEAPQGLVVKGTPEDLTPESVDEVLRDFQERFGTHLQRVEESGIIPETVVVALKASGAGFFAGNAPVAAACVQQAAAHASQAQMYLVRATCWGVASEVTDIACGLLTGDIVSFWFGASVHNALGQLAAESTQKACVAQQAAFQLETAGKLVKWAGSVGGVLTVGLLGYDFYSNISQYYVGNIDGAKCITNITAMFASSGAGLFGGVAGAALLAGCSSPLGLGLGVLAGSFVAAVLTDRAVRKGFEVLLGSDRSRALTKAYSTLGVEETASHWEIRHAYISLAKLHHPDKGGAKEEFLKVNTAYELIRAQRLSL